MLNALLHHAAAIQDRSACWYRSPPGQGNQRAAGSGKNAGSPDPAWCGNCKNTPSTAIIWRWSWAAFPTGGWVDAPVGRHPVQRTKMAVTRERQTGAHLLSGAGKASKDARCSDAAWKPAARIRFACTCTRLDIRWWETRYMAANRKGTFTDADTADRFSQAGPSCAPAGINPSATWGENGVARAVTRRYEKTPADAGASE